MGSNAVNRNYTKVVSLESLLLYKCKWLNLLDNLSEGCRVWGEKTFHANVITSYRPANILLSLKKHKLAVVVILVIECLKKVRYKLRKSRDIYHCTEFS